MTSDMRTSSILLFMPLLVLVACGEGKPSGTDETAVAAVPEATQAQQRIRAMEDSLSDMALFDRRRLLGLRDVYVAYVQRFPLDSLAPDMLRRAAATSGDLGEHARAVRLYEQLIKDDPQWPRAAVAGDVGAGEGENGLSRVG